MKFCLLLSAVLVAVSAASYEDILFQEFNLYKAQFQKTYNNPLENFRRMEAYLETKFTVESHNLRYRNGEETYEMEINKFSDWFPEEIEMMHGFSMDLRERTQTGKGGVEIYKASNTAAPDHVNWVQKGVVTPVKDQGCCGSCYAFSALGALESQQYLKTKKLVRLSEQEIVDCSGKYGNHGCNGGNSWNTYKYIKENGGVNTEASYPYEAKVGKCRHNKDNNGATCRGLVDVDMSEKALKDAVANIGPISVLIHAPSSFHSYKSGIYYEPKCKNDSSNINHAVLAVGYGVDPNSKQEYWLVKNSWGTDWGEKGYIKMARNKNNMCSIASFGVYPKV